MWGYKAKLIASTASLAVALVAFLLVASSETAEALPSATGKIVVNNDEWTLSDLGFQQGPDTATFALNVASWFTGGTPGSFLAYSTNFGLSQSSLAAAMNGAGHA